MKNLSKICFLFIACLFLTSTASAASTPLVLTSPALYITHSSATLYAGIDPKTAASLVWFEYGTESGVYTNKTSVKAITDPSIVSDSINSLSPHTVYRFRAVAKNIDGTSYGKELSFQTNIAPPAPPVVSSSSSSSNSSSSASNSSVNSFSSVSSNSSSSKSSSIPSSSLSASTSSSNSTSSSLSSSSVSSLSSASFPSQSSSSPAPTFSRNMSRGTVGEDVRALQTLLAKDKSIYPEGLITGTYGPLTEKAVRKFQAKYNLPQAGEVGPLTRMILQTAQNTTTSSSFKTPKPSPVSGFTKKITMPIKKQSAILESLAKKGIPVPFTNTQVAKDNYRPTTKGQTKLSESQSPLLNLNFDLGLNGAGGEIPTKSDGTIISSGLDGNGVALSNKSYLSYSATSDNFNKDSGTFELWFRPYTWATDGQVIHRLFDARFECQTEGCLNYMLLDIDNYNKKIIFKINDAQVPWDSNGSGEKQAVYNFKDITQWQWHHLTVSWDKQTGSKMYFDGKKVAENTQPFNLGNPYGDIVFSSSELNDLVGNMSPGSYVDFLNIYGYPKTENEIFSDYNTLKDPVFTFKTDDASLDFKITGKILDKFPDHQDANVAGQDGGASIPYNGKSFWMFADTFLKNGGFANNNIALSVQPIKDTNFENISLNYKKDAQGNAAPVLLPQTGEDLIWPVNMFNNNGIVYTYYTSIKMDEATWFYSLGEGWAKSTAPITDINKTEFVRTGAYWPSKEKTWTNDGPGWPVYDDGTYVYMTQNFGKKDDGITLVQPGAFMTRVKKSEVENLTAHEYWNGTTWTKDKNQKVNIFPAPYNETVAGSVIGWNGYLNKYLMIHNAGPWVNLIAARVSDSITGPWSEAKILVDCDKDLNNLFPCYAATYHPEYNKDSGKTIYLSAANSPRYYLYGLEVRLEKIKTQDAKYINQILSTGQSLSVGQGGNPALSTTQPYNNVMLNGISLTALVENGLETISSAMANSITAKAGDNNYQITVTRHGVGGMPYSYLKKGTTAYQNGINQVVSVKNAAEVQSKKSKVIGVTAIHGESDQSLGNAPYYEGYLVEWQRDYENDVKAITKQVETVALFTDQMSSHTMFNSATADVAIAQLSASENNPGKIILVGPKYFLNYFDGIHLTNASYRWLGEYYGKVIKKVVADKQEWRPLSPKSITRNGNILEVKFYAPKPPIVFDTLLVSARKNFGFEYYDDNSSASISKVEIADSETVKITLNATPTGSNQRLRYAYTGKIGAGAGPNNPDSAAGNLRDSDSTTSLYGNTLYNWAIHFDKPVVVGG